MRSARPGWVYVLSHRAWRGIGPTGMVKIGKTTQDPRKRAAQITSVSGLLAPCKVEWCCWVSDIDCVEPTVHAALDKHRVRARRELFAVDVDTARDAILRAQGVRFKPTKIPSRQRRRRTRAMSDLLALLTVAAAIGAVWMVWP
jgi:hypothetical protein